MMLRTILILTVAIHLIGCSKEKIEPSSSITVNYNIGDHFIYESYREMHYDDTTQTNKDTSIYTTDTIELFIEKDTVINSKKCLVFLTKSTGESNQKSYLEITDTSYNYYAYLFVQNNEILFYKKPIVACMKTLMVGSNWDNGADVPNKMIVKELSSINIQNKNYYCAKIQLEQPDTFIANFEEYVNEKGEVLIKYDIPKYGLIFTDKSAGYAHGKYKWTRIE